MSKVNYIRIELKNNLDQEEIVKHIEETLIGLKKIDYTLFSNWYEQSTSRKKSMDKIVIVDYEYIKDIVLKNWDKKFPELGTYFKLWTGNIVDENNFKLSFKLGIISKNVNLLNSAVLEFPYYSDEIVINESSSIFNKIISLFKNIWNNSTITIH